MDTKQQSTSPDSRPPVVAILGHVDHGKTTLLDSIRKTNVATSEHGGITQAIGAYQIEHPTKEGKQKITFIDTPGHAAFARMRARGATAADIAILVVAANDGVMPQTKESIAHIKDAGVPYIVALTKSDLPQAMPGKVKQQLLKEGVMLEGLGGDVPAISVSAKTGEGLDDLLDMILLVSQITGITGSLQDPLEAVVIEAKRDRRKGVVVAVVVRSGTLSVGDEITAETAGGKVRALTTDTGENVKSALPGMPVEILGFTDIPVVGSKVVKKSQLAIPKQAVAAVKQESAIMPQMEPATSRLALILKADTAGSLEAIKQSLPTSDIMLILSATGDPTETDVLLGKTARAIIVGFNTRVSSSVARLAEAEGVLIKTYTLIYELLDELEEAIALFKQGKPQELILGKAQVQAVFPFDRKTVAGSKVLSGRIAKGDRVRVERGDAIIGEGRVVSLRRGKEDVGKAQTGEECGILLSVPLDFEPQDVILSVR